MMHGWAWNKRTDVIAFPCVACGSGVARAVQADSVETRDPTIVSSISDHGGLVDDHRGGNRRPQLGSVGIEVPA